MSGPTGRSLYPIPALEVPPSLRSLESFQTLREPSAVMAVKPTRRNVPGVIGRGQECPRYSQGTDGVIRPRKELKSVRLDSQ